MGVVCPPTLTTSFLCLLYFCSHISDLLTALSLFSSTHHIAQQLLLFSAMTTANQRLLVGSLYLLSKLVQLVVLSWAPSCLLVRAPDGPCQGEGPTLNQTDMAGKWCNMLPKPPATKELFQQLMVYTILGELEFHTTLNFCLLVLSLPR